MRFDDFSKPAFGVSGPLQLSPSSSGGNGIGGAHDSDKSATSGASGAGNSFFKYSKHTSPHSLGKHSPGLASPSLSRQSSKAPNMDTRADQRDSGQDPFASSFQSGSASSSQPVASSAGQQASSSSRQKLAEPDYFGTSHARTASPGPMAGSSATPVAPTPGPANHDEATHPWAQMFKGPSGGSNPTLGHLVPPTPAAMGPSALSLPTRRKPVFDAQSLSGASSKSAQKPWQPAFSARNGASSSVLVPPAKQTAPSDDLSRYEAIDSDTLASLLGGLGQSSSSLLVIDIRPSTSFATRRVRGSINVCAPSTLLKRSGVTVHKVEESMLQSEDDRKKFAKWRQGPMKTAGATGKANATTSKGSADGVERILVVDTDTHAIEEAGRPAVGGGGPCLLGMLRKFDAAGYAGHLSWLVGGFARFSALAEKSDQADLVEEGRHSSGDTESEGNRAALPTGPGALSSTDPSRGGSAEIAPGSARRGRSMMQLGGLPMEAFMDSTTTKNEKAQHASDVNGAKESRTGNGGVAACNPFFDNIRQNRELQHGITERIPLEVPSLSGAEKSLLPSFLFNLIEKESSERAEILAQHFFDVEKAEQARLMSTMNQHASQSDSDGRASGRGTPSAKRQDQQADGTKDVSQLSSAYCRVSGARPLSSLSSSSFPFSIAAALERGAENRYNNIWTYEHSRLKVPASTAGDYINGSYVEPMKQYGSYRQYIATQAPLPTTFETFWSAVWQENSRTIVMLTREHESGRLQSHNYWDQKHYGPDLCVEVLEEQELDGQGNAFRKPGESSDVAPGSSVTGQAAEPEDGGFFSQVSAAKNGAPAAGAGNTQDAEPTMVVRKIKLSNKAAPNEGDRVITQLQYVGWPDYSIPSDPEALLTFMDMASQSQMDAHLTLLRERQSRRAGPVRPNVSATMGNGRSDPTKDLAVGPLLLHCSAGVGRTGTYIVIDTVLDVLRRERRRRRGLPAMHVWDNGLLPRATDGLISPTNQDVEMLPADAPPAQIPQTPDRMRLNNGGAATATAWPPRLDLDGASSPASALSLSMGGGVRGTRKSLKRDLSPSASMDVDQQRPGSGGGSGIGAGEEDRRESGGFFGQGDGRESTGGFFSGRRGSLLAGDATMMRRNRSNETQGSDVAVDEAASSVSSLGAPGTSGAAGSFGWGGVGIRQPDGMDTPSRAMDGMSLGFNSPMSGPSSQTPSSSRLSTPNAQPQPSSTNFSSPRRRGSLAAGAGGGSSRSKRSATLTSGVGSSNASSVGGAGGSARASPAPVPGGVATSSLSAPATAAVTLQALAGVSGVTAGTQPAAFPASNGALSVSPPQLAMGGATTANGDKPSSAASAGAATGTSGVDEAATADLIRHATDVAREQRMSSVQTQRQYVFCYLAVLHGVLREARREGLLEVGA